MENRHAKLINNTAIFALSTATSKFIVFLMMRYYTNVLSPAEYSVADRIITTSDLIMPFVMISISDAVFRFTMDDLEQAKVVFTAGLRTAFWGFFIFLAVSPALRLSNLLSPYVGIIAIYVLFGILRNIVTHFVRAIGYIKLFAVDGVLANITTIGFNILLLSKFHLGYYGFVYANVFCNILSVLFLTITAKLWKYISLKESTKLIGKKMRGYSIPLVPTTLCWWIMNVSDRYMITYYMGETANGLYAAASKLPGLLTLVSSVFYQAWQISAIAEKDDSDAQKFYEDVYYNYVSLLLIAGTGLLLFIKPVYYILYAENYRTGWVYVPLLVLSQVYSTLVTFLGTFHMVKKNTKTITIAILAGAVLNIGLNMIFIPKYGAIAAAGTTFLSCLVAFYIRIFGVKRIMPFEIHHMHMCISVILLFIQYYLLLKYSMAWQFVMVGIILIYNIKPLLELKDKLLCRLH